MASLQIRSKGFGHGLIALKLGANRLGRSQANDFQIEHASVSARHCEVVLSGSGLLARDCGSASGHLYCRTPDQGSETCCRSDLRLGEVEFLVESTEAKIAIPKFDVLPKGPWSHSVRGGSDLPKTSGSTRDPPLH